jgi:hypothetical protein
MTSNTGRTAEWRSLVRPSCIGGASPAAAGCARSAPSHLGRGALVAAIALASGLASACVELPPRGPMPASASWTGTWYTDYGTVEMVQSGDSVAGRYYDLMIDRAGTLSGTIDGNYLEFSWGGSWDLAVESGYGVFVMQGDGGSFVGQREAFGEFTMRWNGSRVW